MPALEASATFLSCGHPRQILRFHLPDITNGTAPNLNRHHKRGDINDEIHDFPRAQIYQARKKI
jgi:hypothetical protein